MEFKLPYMGTLRIGMVPQPELDARAAEKEAQTRRDYFAKINRAIPLAQAVKSNARRIDEIADKVIALSYGNLDWDTLPTETLAKMTNCGALLTRILDKTHQAISLDRQEEAALISLSTVCLPPRIVDKADDI